MKISYRLGHDGSDPVGTLYVKFRQSLSTCPPFLRGLGMETATAVAFRCRQAIGSHEPLTSTQSTLFQLLLLLATDSLSLPAAESSNTCAGNLLGNRHNQSRVK